MTRVVQQWVGDNICEPNCKDKLIKPEKEPVRGCWLERQEIDSLKVRVLVDKIHCFAQQGTFIIDSTVEQLNENEEKDASGIISKRIRLKVSSDYEVILEQKCGCERLYVNFNPSVVARNSDQVSGSPANDLRHAIEVIKQKLIDDGIKVAHFERCEISRLDIAKDILSPFPFEMYTPMFDYVDGSYLKRVTYEGSYYFENRGLDFCIYDKTKELQERGGDMNCHI